MKDRSIFGAFKQAAELQANIILFLFPASRNSDHPQEMKEMETQTTPSITDPTKTCPDCGDLNQINSEFCINYGTNLPAKDI